MDQVSFVVLGLGYGRGMIEPNLLEMIHAAKANSEPWYCLVRDRCHSSCDSDECGCTSFHADIVVDRCSRYGLPKPVSGQEPHTSPPSLGWHSLAYIGWRTTVGRWRSNLVRWPNWSS